jgi:hypothetical protein
MQAAKEGISGILSSHSRIERYAVRLADKKAGEI